MMTLLHFRKQDEEYIVITDDPKCAWEDHAKPGFSLHTAANVIGDDTHRLPSETVLVPEE